MQKVQYTFLNLRRFLFYKTEIWKDGITSVLMYYERNNRACILSHLFYIYLELLGRIYYAKKIRACLDNLIFPSWDYSIREKSMRRIFRRVDGWCGIIG